MVWGIELRRRSNQSLLIRLISFSGVILLSFGIVGYMISDHLISNAKQNRNESLRSRPPRHLHSHDGPPPHHISEELDLEGEPPPLPKHRKG